MTDNPFQPLPGAGDDAGSAGEPSLSASAIAAAAAAAAVRGAPAPTLQSEEAQYVQPTQESVQNTVQSEPELPNPQATMQPTGEMGQFASEAYSQLSALGIDLPVDPQTVAPEFRQAYDALAQKVLDTFQMAQDRMVTAEVTSQQMESLSQRLSTPEGQQRLILSMALANPETFNQAMEIVQRTQVDPDYAESQRMRLEAEARFEQAQRMEKAMRTTQMQTKGQQVEGRTERLAKQMGVNVDIAKQMVASRILQNEAVNGVRDITFNEVDQVIKSLAQATNARPAVMTPTAAQQQSQAPQTPVAGTRTPPSPHQQQAPTAPRGSQTTPNSDAMDALRAAVRASATSVRSKGL